jgi:hypothetical protein
MILLNDTHHAPLRCRVELAEVPDCDFPIQNLSLRYFNGDGPPTRRRREYEERA